MPRVMATSKKTSLLSDPVIILQLVLAGYACYATWGLNVLDGSVGRMLAIFKADVPVLTGTTDAFVKTRFTGIPRLTTGSHPATIIEGMYFFGQVTAMWTLMCMEGRRVGNRGLVIAKAMMWLYITHNLTIACFAPIYFILHHQSSPTSRTMGLSTEPRSRVLSAIRQLRYLPLSIFLGLIVPFLYTGLPSPDIISYTAQQNAIAFTIFYPTWVRLPRGSARRLHAGVAARLRVRHRHRRLHAHRRRRHLGGVAGVSGGVRRRHPGAVPPPEPAAAHEPPVHTIGAGIFNFMKRDQWIGYASLWLWVLRCYQDSPALAIKTWGQALRRGVEVVASMSLLGASGAAALFLWRRDELLCAQEKASLETTARGRSKA
ncbi:hypothetical protein PG984_015597 [Apiospora sp. TS-2023a]